MMVAWKPIARLGLGWGLMLAGVAAIFDSGTALRPRNQILSGAEAIGGLALIAIGWWLRRHAMRGNSR